MKALGLLAILYATAHADDEPLPPARNSLVLAPRLDPYCKTSGQPSAQSFGLGIHFMGDFPPRAPFWYGLGLDARVLTAGWNDLGALAIGGVAKVTAGHAPPLTLELDAGAIISGSDSGGYAGGAVLLSMFYFEIGYAYQYPIGVDDHPWLGNHQVVLRGIIPVLTR